jgi:hypothetical protein
MRLFAIAAKEAQRGSLMIFRGERRSIAHKISEREAATQRQSTIQILAVTVALAWAIGTARAAPDAMKYPDWEGQWERIGGGGQFDTSKPPGRGQETPLTAEYQAIWDGYLKEQARGGQNYNTQAHCLPGGMPRLMMALEPMEIIIMPKTTYVVSTFNNAFRRIYTDGRDWPTNAEPTFNGYSIGKWIDEDGDGSFDVLEVESRDFRGPRQYDSSGMPLHDDNRTVIKERMYLDKSNPNVMHDEITTFDHALTRPWTVTRDYGRRRDPVWLSNFCFESNQYVFIGGESYLVSVDGFLMPLGKGEPPPDLRNFNQPP